MQIDLTPAEAAAIRRVFFPRNPNKLRNASAEIKMLASRVIAALDREAAKKEEAAR